MIEEYGHKKQEINRIRANILEEQGIFPCGREENGGRWDNKLYALES